MWNDIKQFFATRTISSHTFVGAYLTLTAFVAADEGARDYVVKHPIVSSVLNLAAIAYARWAGAHNTQGQAIQLANTATTQLAKVASAVAAANQQTPVGAPELVVKS